MRIAPIAVAIALAPAFAFARPDPSTTTCATYTALGVDEQVALLSTLQPFGDEMNASDEAASKQWAATVSAACRDHPDRLLPDAARDSMGE